MAALETYGKEKGTSRKEKLYNKHEFWDCCYLKKEEKYCNVASVKSDTLHISLIYGYRRLIKMTRQFEPSKHFLCVVDLIGKYQGNFSRQFSVIFLKN